MNSAFYSSFLNFVSAKYPYFLDSFSDAIFSEYMISPHTVPLSSVCYQQAVSVIQAVASLRYNSAFMPQPCSPSVLMSFDFYCTDNRMFLLEINTNASGILLAFLLEQYHGFQQGICLQDLHQMFSTAFPSIQSGIAIVDEDPLSQKTYFEQYQFLRLFQHWGYPAFHWNVHDIQFKNGSFYLQEQHVHNIYNRYCDFYLSIPSALQDAIKSHGYNPTVNPHPQDYDYFANKARLVQFSDPQFLATLQLSEAKIKAITAVLPPVKDVKKENSDSLWGKRKTLFLFARILVDGMWCTNS